ncbi:MAG: rod shape-determining protein MreC, partial [Gammaproteobacteria bacterium]
GPPVFFRTLVLILASIVLMTADHRWHQLEIVRNALSHLLYPLQYTIDLPIRLYYWGDETLSEHQTLLDENRKLKDLHLQSRVQLQKLDILEKENARLRELLSATPKISERVLVAEIMSVDVDPYRQLLILNKSSRDDVYDGQPVIDAQGVMGQIVHVSASSSTMMLITDASHALPVQIDRTGLRAVAFGTGKIDYLDLRHIPHNADVREGDLLITSGLGGRFPPNYPVAKITHIERPMGEPFVNVRAEPLARLDRSREVLLVWHNPPTETEAPVDELPVVEPAAEPAEKPTAGDATPADQTPATNVSNDE